MLLPQLFFFSRARWTALATTPSTIWQSAGQLGDRHSNAATGLKVTLRVGHFNMRCSWTTMSGAITPNSTICTLASKGTYCN